MLESGKRLTRILILATVGLIVGCGGGGGGDGCPEGPIGEFDLAVDIRAPCADNVLGVWTGDIEVLGPGEIRILIHLPETKACCPETLFLHGMETVPNFFEMDDVPDTEVCALRDQYGYESIGITGAVLNWTDPIWILTGDVTVIAGAACLGTLRIEGSSRR